MAEEPRVVGYSMGWSVSGFVMVQTVVTGFDDCQLIGSLATAVDHCPGG